jgi:hypothetical protein
LPSRFEIGYFVAANAAIVDVQVESRVFAQNFTSEKERITAPEWAALVGIGLVLPVATGVRDGVALEKDGCAF